MSGSLRREDMLVATASRVGTAPVLAVLVCHDGDAWLPEVLAALGQLTVRPRHVLAVDTGSTDRSAELLEQASADGETVLDGVLTLPAETGFGAAVSEALDHATQRWGDPGQWLWLLHDDSAPEPECLENLLHVADLDSAAAMLGPLGLNWHDPRLVVDAGVSTDASGHRQTGVEPSELDPALDGASSSALLVSEVLAVSSACALIRRDVFEQLGGFDPALRLAFDDVDLGWRINTAGHLVLCVPGARMRHVGALRSGDRAPDAVSERTSRTVERVHGVRTFLVNTTAWSFALGLPRLFALTLLRVLGFALLRRLPEATAELAVLGRLLTGRMDLRAARAARRAAIPKRYGIRGLLTSRLTRLRNGLRGAFAGLVRDRIRRDVVLGRAPATGDLAVAAEPVASRPVGPDALPAGALGSGGRRRSVAGLRRPAAPVVVPLEAPALQRPSPKPRPSPVPRGDGGAPAQELVLVPVDRWRVLRELLLTPPVVLTAALIVFALVSNGLLAEFSRFGLGLHGGRLLPAANLEQTWADYLAAWHPVNGGTGAPAPAALLVLAVAGTVLAPLGGPPTVVALLMLFGVPLAGLTAYSATHRLPVSRLWRATAAGAYAVLPVATLSAGQGRLDVVVTHILVPVLLAGIAAVIGLSRLAPVKTASVHWLGTACLTALGLAVLGAFAPLMLAALLALAVLGFVLVPSEARRAPRRVAGLAAVVLLPVGCLLPWPVALVRDPQILLHGLGARVSETSAGAWLLALSPDGSPASWVGILLVLIAVGVLIAAPTRGVIPGAAVAFVGWAVAILVDSVSARPLGDGPSTTGWTGAPLVLAGAGLVWMVLAASPRPRWHVPPRIAASALIVSLLALTAGAAVAGRNGPLRAQEGETTPALASDLAGPSLMLMVEPGPYPARLVAGKQPHFGDEDLAPVGTAVDWLYQVDADLVSTDAPHVRAALAATAARGAEFVAVPDVVTAARLRTLAGGLVADHGRLADGRQVLRVLLPSSPVELLGPDLARQARVGGTPSPEARPLAVDATLPHVAVRVSDGGAGRALVLAAENEPGWQAWIDGRTAPLATAWGHQVAIPLPERASEVQVTYTEIPRTSLLVLQAAAILFALIGALPERRRRV